MYFCNIEDAIELSLELTVSLFVSKELLQSVAMLYHARSRIDDVLGLSIAFSEVDI